MHHNSGIQLNCGELIALNKGNAGLRKHNPEKPCEQFSLQNLVWNDVEMSTKDTFEHIYCVNDINDVIQYIICFKYISANEWVLVMKYVCF